MKMKIKALFSNIYNKMPKDLKFKLIAYPIFCIILTIMVTTGISKIKSEVAIFNSNAKIFFTPKNETIITQEMLSSTISKIAELSTLERTYVETYDYTEHKQVGGVNVPFTGAKCTVVYDGIIKAGINLEDIDINIDEESKEVTVKLGNVKILSHTQFEDTLKIVDSNESILKTIDQKAVFDELESEKSNIEKKIISNGFLTESKAETKAKVKSLVESIVGSEYTVYVV